MLQKQGERGLTKGFKKRYMVQKQAKIFYYKSKSDTKHIGSINLVEALRIEVAKEGKTHFKVRPLPSALGEEIAAGALHQHSCEAALTEAASDLHSSPHLAPRR